MSKPSEKAIEAAHRAKMTEKGFPIIAVSVSEARAIVTAAHNPSLGLDRSVCLRDMVEALRQHEKRRDTLAARMDCTGIAEAADFIEREFGS